jgi:hypothetical protein
MHYRYLGVDEGIILKFTFGSYADLKLLSGFPWPINGNPDNNLESSCILTAFLRFRIWLSGEHFENSDPTEQVYSPIL